MKAAVLGAGLMGTVIAKDLSISPTVDRVVVADIDEESLARARKGGGRKLLTERLDIKNQSALVKFLKGFDVVSSALPHGVVNAANVAAVKAGAKMVDIAFEDEQMELDEAARSKEALLIPGCGLAPGLGGILLAHGSRRIGGATEGHIYVGGIPQSPRPPFGYRLVFSVVGLLREYMEEARVVRNGRTVKVKPFDEIFPVEFAIGRLEGFYTDGLASLVYTMKGFQELDEVTLRWPGHAEKMKLLIDTGFFSKKKVAVDGKEIAPFEVNSLVLAEKLKEGDARDMTVMRVIATKGGRGLAYELIDKYDEKNGITSMGRTTGYTCSIVTQMVGEGSIKGKGVIPPEVALDRKVEELVSEHARRGVIINEKKV